VRPDPYDSVMIQLGALLVVVGVFAVGCGDADDGGGLDPATDSTSASNNGGELDADPGGDETGLAADGAFGRDELGAFVNSCAVLTEAEVAAATGLVVIGSEDEPNLGCRWFVENVDLDIIGDDAITWQPFPVEQYEFQEQAVEQGLDGEHIADLGNGAAYIGTDMLGEVWVSLDELSFRVGNQFAFGNYDARPAQEALAAAIVEALEELA